MERIQPELGEYGQEEREEFGELLKFTVPGFAGGLLLGAVLDSLGFQRSPIGQWVVRTLSREVVAGKKLCYANRYCAIWDPEPINQPESS